MHPEVNNIGAYITSKLAKDPSSVGAGFGSSGTKVTGNVFNRTEFRPLHLSGKLQTGYKATLASGHTATFESGVEHSDASGGTYEPYDVASGVTTVTGDASGTSRGVVELDVNLAGAKQFVRPYTRVTLSASGVDVVAMASIWALGGGENIPPTESL